MVYLSLSIFIGLKLLLAKILIIDLVFDVIISLISSPKIELLPFIIILLILVISPSEILKNKSTVLVFS